jgi:hypothetical protein
MITKTEMQKFARTIRLNGGKIANREAIRALKPVHFAINERAGIAARIAECAVDGKIQLVRSGMDCDCTKYLHSTTISAPTSIFQFQRDENKHREWLDGTENTWLERPSEDVYESRDLALEAFEDGHPHVIYA